MLALCLNYRNDPDRLNVICPVTVTVDTWVQALALAVLQPSLQEGGSMIAKRRDG